jgi:hypothetical protein
MLEAGRVRAINRDTDKNALEPVGVRLGAL